MNAPEFRPWDAAALGPPGEQAMRACFEKQGYATARYVYPPGTEFPDHTHDIDKLDGVLSGELEIVAAGQRWILAAGDSLYLPAGLVHSARVLGASAVVSIDATRRT